MATTTNSYAPNQERAKFRSTVEELMRKRKDPNYVKFALEQAGYDSSVVDEELNRMQAISTGQPLPQESTPAIELTPAKQQELVTENSSRKTLIENAKQYKELVDKYGFESTVTNPEIAGKMGGLRSGLLADIKKAETLGTLDKGLLDFADMLLGVDPTGPLAPIRNIGGSQSKLISSKIDELISNSTSKIEENQKLLGTTETQVKLNTPEEAAKWLETNPNDPRAEQVRKKLESVGYKAPLGDNAAPVSSAVVEQPVSNALGKIGDFLGIKKFGEGIGTAIFLKTTEGKDLQKKAAEGDKVALETLQAILDEAPNNKELIGSAALTALNAASGGILKGAIGATSAAGKVAAGAAGGYAYDVAGDLEQNKSIAEVATPGIGTATGGVLATAGVISNWVGKKGERAAERVYNSTVKPSIEDTKKAILYNGKTLGRKLIDEGIAGGDAKLLVKATAGLNTNESKLQKILSSSKETITREELVPYLTKLKERLASTPTTRAQKAMQTVDESLNLLPESFSLSKANDLKRKLYQELGDLAYKLDPGLSGSAETSKVIASGLKDLIEKKAGDPSVATLNQKLATFYQLQDGVLENLARRTRNNLAGVGTLGALIEKTLGAPAVKTYGALVIDKAAKKLQTLGSGAGGKITKAMIMNAIREAQDEEATR